ncbi:MAG: UDP-N-acetylglucosamine 1-carboxyvinyltransferase, partial [Devosia sp.]
MDRIRLIGGNPLRGEIPISGAKNAALPLMIASLLSKDPLVLENVPRLADVKQLEAILENHGVDIAVHGRKAGADMAGQRMTLTAGEIVDTTAPYELVSTMRASFWVIGPLLARAHEARVSLPGGCAIGTRPVDLFLYGLKELGAEIDIDEGYVVAKAPKGGLRGARINFPKVTVGATHVIMMAATLAKGTTVIENAAMEPEVTDVAECLVKMGARISGIGTRTLTIEGVDELHGATHEVVPDRIETGTYAMAAAMAGGDVLLRNARPQHLQSALDILGEAGVSVKAEAAGLRIARNGNGIRAVDVETEPFPGFPTDLQAQFMALMTMSGGVSQIRETIVENRYMQVAELARFGADLKVDG